MIWAMRAEQAMDATRVPGVSERDLGWLAGITDGEGCFTVVESWRPCFKVGSRYDDVRIQKKLQSIFGCGTISLQEHAETSTDSPSYTFAINSIKDIVLKVCPIFDKCRFISRKAKEYPWWRELSLIAFQWHWKHKKNIPQDVKDRAYWLTCELSHSKHLVCMGKLGEHTKKTQAKFLASDYVPLGLASEWGHDPVG